jgi:hypothetical protein
VEFSSALECTLNVQCESPDRRIVARHLLVSPSRSKVGRNILVFAHALAEIITDKPVQNIQKAVLTGRLG